MCLLSHTEDVAALLDVVLDVIIRALVSELRHFDLLSRELLVEVVEVQAWWRQLLQTRREHGSLQTWHRRLELRRDQSQGLVLHADRLVELQHLGYQVSVEAVQLLVEERSEVLGEVVRLLETAAQSVSKSGDVRHVMVLGHFGLVLDGGLEVAFVLQQPVEDTFLNLLVVLLLEKVVVEELHRAHHEELSSLERHVEGADGAVCRETNGAGREECAAGLANVERRAVGVDKLQSAVLVAVIQVVLRVAVLLRILPRFVLVFFLAAGSPIKVSGTAYLLGEFVREAPVADVGLLGMKVLVEGLSHHAVRVDADADLLEHCVDVGGQLGLAALVHHDDAAAALLDVAADVLQLLSVEGQTRSTEQEHVALLKALEGQLGLIDFALVSRL